MKNQLLRSFILDVHGSSTPFAAAAIDLDDLRGGPFLLPKKGDRIKLIDGPKAAAATTILEAMGHDVVIVQDAPLKTDGCRYRLWSVPSQLKEFVDNTTPGSALCLGCGTGREAVLLASAGWSVMAVDCLDDALQQGKILEQSFPGSQPIQWICSFADEYLASCQGKFDLVTSFMFFDPNLLPWLKTHLAPAGVALIKTYSMASRVKTGRPKNVKLIFDPAKIDDFPELDASWEESHVKVRARIWLKGGPGRINEFDRPTGQP